MNSVERVQSRGGAYNSQRGGRSFFSSLLLSDPFSKEQVQNDTLEEWEELDRTMQSDPVLDSAIPLRWAIDIRLGRKGLPCRLSLFFLPTACRDKHGKFIQIKSIMITAWSVIEQTDRIAREFPECSITHPFFFQGGEERNIYLHVVSFEIYR